MVKLVIWFMALAIVVFLAIDPGLSFRFEAQIGRRSLRLHALTVGGVCTCVVARRQLACL